MRKATLLWSVLLGITGCHGEYQIRTEPDLWRVTSRQASRLRRPILARSYRPSVTDPSSWQIHSSLTGREALTDGDPATIASSNDDHRRGEYILVDLGSVCRFQAVRQFHPAGSGHPPRFRIDTAGDHGFPYDSQFVGSGQPDQTSAVFPKPVSARFFKITLIEDTAEPWHVSELAVE